MPNINRFLAVCTTFFAVIGLAHLVRALAAWPIVVDGWSVPLTLSWVAMLVTGALSVWAFALLKRQRQLS